MALTCGLVAIPLRAADPQPGTILKLSTPAVYLPAVPVLVRVEVIDPATGRPDRGLWDAEAVLTASPAGVTLSTNRITLRNGLGSALVTCSGGGDFTLTATVGALSTNRSLVSRAGAPVLTASGSLTANTTWTGVVQVTATVTVPTGRTLTIESNTLVIINGVASGTAGAGLVVNGTLNSLGTELHPVTITCADAALRWGQIRHDNAQPSLYRHTIITRAGRAPGEGHTGQAPVLRPNGSTVTFENCSITDHADASGTPGKIGSGINSDLTFRNCLLSRARMGPEIQGTALLFTNSWILEMRGPDDSDGIYLHDQAVGQQIRLVDSVFGYGDDDGIDTLSADVTVENCIIRNWPNSNEDAKGISAFSRTVNVKRCVIVDCWVGVSAKTTAGASATVNIENSTISGISNTLAATFKANAPGPIVDIRVTNSILRGIDPVKSDFAATNFSIGYSIVGESWPGTGNLNVDPLFIDEAARDFRLRAGSPAINAGLPSSPLDADGTRADLGAFPFIGGTNTLIALGASWKYLDNGSDQGTAWRARAFDDSTWAAGPAQLGYGDGDEATVIGFGPDSANKYVTTYFRRAFTIPDASAYTNLALRLVRDDGGAVYLNGVEIYRSSTLPAGPLLFNTLAIGLGENDIDAANVTAGLTNLVDGTNVIAVEIHQQALNSSDVSFDLELVGITGVNGSGPVNTPPTVALTAPANGATYSAPATVSLAATADDPGGSVARVEFFQNGNKLGEDTTSPFTFDWSNAGAGVYSLTAVATDNQGASTTSAAIGITINATGGPTTNTLIAAGSVWKYLDNGVDQGTAWVAPGFDDGTWASGPGQLGYGDGDEATILSFGPNTGAKYPTYYFRRTFNVANPAAVQSVIVNVLRDDGAVVYLNGTEVYRLSMPAGPITFNTFATTASEYPWEGTNVGAALLVPGVNVIACEVHQANATSSDMTFDLELLALASAETNARPAVSLTAPASGLTVAAPASLTLTASASDPDGSVTNVAFLANGALLGNDTSAPYSFAWNNVPAGAYTLAAVATDNVGLSTTSSVVTLTVSANTAPPAVLARTPAAGTVSSLTQVTVTFTKPVLGVDAADFLVNGTPAAGLTGTLPGTNFTFTFPQPALGTVSITWAAGHGITDIFTPPVAFNATGAGATWQYQLIDTAPPIMATLDPAPGSGVAALTSVAITFNEPVTGVNASDLLVNSVAALNVAGTGAGPYVFSFPQPAITEVPLAWAAATGIQDLSGNPFAGGSWSYTINTNASGVVISEIHYHPASEDVREEFIELYNKGASPVNLAGWRLSAGVQFTFPNVSIPAGGFLVVAADTNVFATLHPDVPNVVGNWTGFLGNGGEDIDLDNAEGNRVDSVEYADEGDWAIRQRGLNDPGTGGQPHRGWIWFKAHDGLGRTLELINTELSNNEGQNWASSLVNDGTPGVANSVRTNNIAPMILDAVHAPLIPRSTNTTVVTTRIVDESPNGLTVVLNWRADAATPPPFTALAMRDDGTAGDVAPGDGLFSATIPPQANNTVVEYYISATDQAGQTRTWPAPAIASADGAGPTGQVANALFQVDDTAYAGSQPLYKMVMTEVERAELAAIPGQSSLQGPNSLMNGTFISLDGAGASLRYLVGIRNRGHGSRTANPPNYHVAFRSDEPWKKITGLNLNTRFVHLQHLGSILARLSGADGADSIAVQVRVNNQNLAVSGSPMFGSYAANEQVSGDWAGNHFPDDGNGNVYRVIRDIAPPDLSYRGENANSYTNTYFKESNVSENNWTDLIGMLRVVGINNATSFTTENVRQVVNVEQWMRHLAFMSIVNNRESGLNTGFNDDYFMYAGVTDPRFILSYWDLDTILGGGDSPGSATEGIYSSTANNGSGLAIDRFLRWPDFEPVYFETFRTLLNTVFEPTNFNATVDTHLGPYVQSATIAAIKSWAAQRRSHILSILPASGVTNPPVAVLSGTPRSPTPLTGATITVGGPDVAAYRFALNGGDFGAEISAATPIVLSSLPAGTNTLAVIARHVNGTWQANSNATVRSWIVNPAWPAVRLNEILAQNDSALNVSGTFPDAIELFNEGAATADLSGLRLTDDPSVPGKYTFPAGTTLAAGARLVVYANNPDGTPGIHVGFSLDADGEGVYLFSTAASGNVVLDSVVFGLQLPDRSIGRVSGGDWVLTTPSFGQVNVAQALGQPSSVRINEWQAAGAPPYPDDFIELYNTAALPVALGGLHLTDQTIGAPRRSRIADLSFVAPGGYRVFLADGKSSPANHVNFSLAVEQGEIGFTAADGSILDSVIYGPQKAGVSGGRCPDGAAAQRTLVVPTPGSPNACPVAPPAPVTVTLIPLTNSWRYEESNTDLGTAWSATSYDDTAWPSGQALLGLDTNLTPPEPIRTPLTVVNGKFTFYFRTRFNVPANLNISELQVTHATDDGAVFYLNGVEAGRIYMPAGPITFTTPASVSHEATSLETITISKASLVPGDNVLAVEVHQNTANSSDIIFGLRLDAVIVTNTPSLAGVVINEILANNATLEEADGSKPDWTEIHNPSQSAVDLADMSLTDDTLTPRRWVFPSGSIVPALGYLRVRMDGSLPSATTNTGFGLKANGGGLYLYNRPADGGGLASFVTYGLQAADFTLARVPDGGTNWVLGLPTAGAANLAANLGNPATLRVNEWMAAPASGDDWIEIFNPNAQPVELSGLWLSDNLGNTRKYQIPGRSFIGAGPQGFLRFWAATGADADFTGFSLAASGEDVLIANAAGVVIDGYRFTAQQSGVSEGRLPDGATNLVRFPTTSTPGNANFLPLTSIVINEVLAHTDPPLEDAIELHNPTGDDVAIGGWYLSDAQDNLLKFRIPAGTIVPAGGFRVFYEYQFNGENPGTPFSLSSSKGDEIYLSQSTSPAVLTGYRAFAEFGASENGVSFGRHLTSVGPDFTTLSARTFGADNPATTNEFRTGTGRTNAYPKVGPVVINEIMYRPASTNEALEYVELHNLLGAAQPLFDPANPANTWRVRKGIDFNFPTNVTLPPGGFVVLVNFDPATDPVSLAAFRAAYGTNMTILGPYSGRLDNAGEPVELQKPDAPQTLPGPDLGRVPYIVVDRVVYGDTAPWPTSPDGLGDALKRVTAALYGNDPANWIGGSPNPGAPNTVTSGTNAPPVLAAIGNRTVIEGNLLAFTATATDTNQPVQALTFSLDAGAPAGAVITPAGAFTWTPAEAQGPSNYVVTIRVTDNGSPVLSDFETITITVLETNNLPTLNPIGNKTGAEGSLITFVATAIDPDIPSQTLTFSLDAGAPGGASITSGGTFNWTPTEAQGPGNYPVTVRVTDSGTPAKSVTETIQINVTEANVAPVLGTIGNRSVAEGSTLSFTATATDADVPANALTFSLDSGAPAGATISAAGAFSWAPTEAQGPSNYVVTVRVTDNGSPALSDFETFTITVNEVNVAPVLDAISAKSITEGSLLTFTATATDADRPTNTLTFSLDAGAPAGAAISPAGVFTWTPTLTQGPSNYVVTIRVTDNGTPALDDTETVSINVTETALQVALVNFTNVWRYNTSGSNLLTAWRETGYDDSSWATGRGVFQNETGSVIPAPTNTFLPLTGSFGQRITNYYFRTRFVLPAEVSGITLVASNVLDDGAVIYLNGVEAQRLNMPAGPITATTFAASSWEGNVFVVTNVAAAGLLPGENVLAVEVHQQSATSSDVVFGLSLTATVPSQNPIAITQQPTNVTVNAGSPATFTVAVSGSSPFYQWLRNGSPIPGANSASHTIPSAQPGDVGSYSVVVSNLVNSVTSSAASLTVNQPANQAPVLGAIGNRTVDEGSQLAFTATATDPDGAAQTLTYSLDPGAPAGAGITTAGAFTWTPNESQGPVSYTVTIRVTDSGTPALSDFETITITVNEVNVAPTLAPLTNRVVSVGSTLSFTATATDSDLPAQALTWTLQPGFPAGASIGASSGLFTWTPPLDAPASTNTIGIRVSDGALADIKSFNVVVVNAPQITGIVNNGTTVQLTWTSYPGRIYQVQARPDLNTGSTWTNIGSAVTATGYTSSLNPSVSGTNIRFFRVVLTN